MHYREILTDEDLHMVQCNMSTVFGPKSRLGTTRASLCAQAERSLWGQSDRNNALAQLHSETWSTNSVLAIDALTTGKHKNASGLVRTSRAIMNSRIQRSPSAPSAWTTEHASPPAATANVTATMPSQQHKQHHQHNQEKSSQQQHWVRAVTPQGRVYWYSRQTNQTRWTDPNALPSSTTSAKTNAAIAANGKESADPPVWRKALTDKGRVYYYNRLTKTTRWDRPPDFDDNSPSGGINQHTNAVATAESTLRSEVQPNSQSNSNPSLVSEHPTDFANSSAKPASISLPPGWKRLTASNGRPYYYHEATRQTRWQPPSLDDTAPSANSQLRKEHTILPFKRPSSSLSPQTNAQSMPGSETEKPQQPNQLSSQQFPNEQSQNNAKLSSTIPPQWQKSTTADGRVYYYNKTTRETSWTIPSSAVKTAEDPASVLPPKGKRIRTSSPIAVRPAVQQREAADKPGKQNNSPAHVRRPRDSDGKPLTDRAAEKYFLNRASIRQSRNRSESKIDTDKSDGDRNDSRKAANQKKGDLIMRESDNDALQAFYAMLKERCMTSSSSWLQVMARCAEDTRYKAVNGYGRRKDAWERFRQSELRANRRRAILNERQKKEAFINLLHESFDSEPFEVRSIHRCRPDAVRTFEASPVFRAVGESDRISLVKAFFTVRERKGLQERKRRRESVMRQMSDALRDHLDPSLLDEEQLRVQGLNGDRNGDEKNRVNGKSRTAVKGEATEIQVKMELGNSDSEQQEGRQNIDNMDVVKNEKVSKPKIYFTDRSSFREYEAFLSTLPGFDILDQHDINDVVRDHRRHVDRLVEERHAREREARKRMQHENRGDFRSGVLDMLLQGLISFSARWKDVAEKIAKEPFAKPEADLGCRPATLFEDGRSLFEDRVQKQRDKFKQLLKDAGAADAVNETTVDKLVSEHSAIAEFAKSVPRPVIEALLVDRQRKENKRRLKERERLSDQLGTLLRDNAAKLDADVASAAAAAATTDATTATADDTNIASTPSSSAAATATGKGGNTGNSVGGKGGGIGGGIGGGNTWNVDMDAVMKAVRERFKDDKVFTALIGLGGDDSVKMVVDQYVRWKTKEDRKKRKLEQHHSTSADGMYAHHHHHHHHQHHPHMMPIGHGGHMHHHPIDGHLPPPHQHPIAGGGPLHTHPNDRSKRMRMGPHHPSAFGPPQHSHPPQPQSHATPSTQTPSAQAAQQQQQGQTAADEENGWSAVVSEKPMTEEEKLAEKERRKREILGSLETK